MDQKACKIAAKDWRAEVKNESRQKVVENIVEKLKEQYTSHTSDATLMKRLTDIARNFENEMFNKSSTKDLYIINISNKLNKIGDRQGDDASFVKPACAVPESSSIRNLPDASSDVSDKSVFQVKKEEVLVSQPLCQMANQRYQQPAVACQLLQQNFRQSNIGPLTQSNLHVNYHSQRNHIISRETSNQHLLQPALPPQPHEQLHRQKLNAGMLQQNQQFGMHNSSVRQQTILNSPYQQCGLQRHVSGIQMSRDMLTSRSNVSNLQPKENFTCQIKEEVIGEDFRASTPLHPHHSIIQQHKQPPQPHGMLMTASAALTQNSNAENWDDRAYLELQSLKETYLPILKTVYEKASNRRSSVGQEEVIQKIKKTMAFIKNMMEFLEIPRSRFVNFPKDRFYYIKQSIVQYIESIRNRNLDLAKKHGQSGFCQSHIKLVQQSDEANSPFLPLNSASTDALNSSSPMAPGQIVPLTPQESSIASPSSELPVENRLNLLQKRQPTSFMVTSSMENIQASNGSGISWKNHLDSDRTPLNHFASSNVLNDASQKCQTSSQTDQQTLIKDPFASCGRASPSAPLISSSIAVEPGKIPPNVSSNGGSENSQNSRAFNSDISKTEIQVQSHEIRNSGTLSSPLPVEATTLGSNQESLSETQPLNRLLKAVETVSNKALRAAVTGINLVGDMNDTMAEVFPFETMCQQEATNSSLQDGRFSNNVKRRITSTAVNDSSPSCSEIDVSENSTISSGRKKRKTLADKALLDEMRNINQQLLETVLELVPPQNVNRRLADAGTVVQCSYSPVAVSKYQFVDAQKFPVLSLKVLVPVDYPNDYPVFISRFDLDRCSEDEESKALSKKAKSMLCASLRKGPAQVSLEELAKAWDECARTVAFEYARHAGGKCFSSQYGTWEDCIAAT